MLSDAIDRARVRLLQLRALRDTQVEELQATLLRANKDVLIPNDKEAAEAVAGGHGADAAERRGVPDLHRLRAHGHEEGVVVGHGERADPGAVPVLVDAPRELRGHGAGAAIPHRHAQHVQGVVAEPEHGRARGGAPRHRHRLARGEVRRQLRELVGRVWLVAALLCRLRLLGLVFASRFPPLSRPPLPPPPEPPLNPRLAVALEELQGPAGALAQQDLAVRGARPCKGQAEGAALAVRPRHGAVESGQGLVLPPGGLRREGPEAQELVTRAGREARLGLVEREGPDLGLVLRDGLEAQLQLDGPYAHEPVLGGADEARRVPRGRSRPGAAVGRPGGAFPEDDRRDLVDVAAQAGDPALRDDVPEDDVCVARPRGQDAPGAVKGEA
mmetsp:Transcript_52505/g.162956  ORF Transcript_52505/g.162956 Transcript_52505/m.162956 type:complete len:386 (-) Transcript_52505:402-1559(-)